MANIDTDKRVIDIADFLFSNPDKKRKHVMAIYGDRWQCSSRTIDRLLEKAQQYNEERIRTARELRDEALYQNELDAENEGIMSRNEALRILSKIIEGEPQEVVVGKDDNDNDIIKLVAISPDARVKAFAQMAAVQGWSVSKVELTGKGGKDLAPLVIEVIDKREQVSNENTDN